MEAFYDKYNLNIYNFAEIAGVSRVTLVKYAEGKDIRQDAKNRIELAIRIATERNLVYPRIEEYGRGLLKTVNDEWLYGEDCNIYVATFKNLIKKWRALV